MKITNRNPQPRVHGKVEMGQHGWGVRLWHDADPLITNLASKSEAFKLLYALRYGWGSVTLKWFNGSERKVNLQPYWHRRPALPPLETRTAVKLRGAGKSSSSTSGGRSAVNGGSSSTARSRTSGRLVKPWPSGKGPNTSRSGSGASGRRSS